MALPNRWKRRDRGTVILLLALGSAGFGTWWLFQHTRLEELSEQDTKSSAAYFVDGLELTAMTPDGKPKHVLRAKRLVHFDADDRTELTEPQLTVFGKGAPPWEIQAASGSVSGKGDRVRLNGRVEIERAEGATTRPIRVITSDLDIYPDTEYAETKKHVEAYSRSDWVHSDGAKVWFAEPVRIQLLSKVRGFHTVD